MSDFLTYQLRRPGNQRWSGKKNELPEMHDKMRELLLTKSDAGFALNLRVKGKSKSSLRTYPPKPYIQSRV